ncbi:MAG: GAF domain-containing protein, partial [Deltaproteobacteria bacterium]|nr:GAF domain-containing protein [Deltaproteobacteria bacterium]
VLVFDARIQAWRWDVSRIEARGFSDSIVDLMIAKLRRLPPVTQQALQQLACLGGSSKAALLALALCRSEEQTQADLWPALREGLVLYQRGVYRFLHDRVQEAAYALLAEHARAARHLEIGRLMLAHLPQEALAEQVFDVVHQLNRGVRLIEDPEQKATLRRLNLRAGDKAMASGANSAARRYYAQAIDLLPPGCWSTGHEESFALHLKLSECEYLVGNFRRADELFNLLLAQARSNPEKARVYLLRVRLYQVAGKFPEAVEAGLAGLRLFGVSYPDTPQELEAATRAAMSEVAARLRDQGRDKLVQAPACTDADACAVMSLVADLVIAAYNVRRDLSMLIAADGVLLSFRYGSFSRSALAYAGCALAFICFFGELALACDLIDLALQLLEKLEDPLALGRVLFFEAAFVNHLRRPFATSLPIMERSFVTCLEAGDLAWAGFAAQAAVWLSLERGDSLDEVLAVARKYLSFARESHNDTLLQAVMLRQQLPVCLKGRTLQQASLDDSSFDEAACLAAFEKRGYVYGMILFHNVKQQVALFFGDYATAFRSRQRLTALLGADATGIMELPARVFLTLTVLSFWPQASAEEQRRFEEMVQGEVQRLELWARACPENGTCRHALVLAELARVQGRQLDAERLYDQAIQSARESRFVQFEALACELASQFYRSRGLQLIADMYLREARACYVRWGADGKVRQIEEQHPRLVEARRPEGGATLALHAEQLDLLSVVKASQTISSAIVSEELVGTLLRVILEQGGAQKGYLILPRGGALWLEAEAGLGDAGVETRMLGSLPARSSPLVPVTLIEHVALTREPVILDDAAGAAGQFAADAYVARQRPRSVLCLPVVRQAELVGLVYLENNLVQGAFTPARLAALTLIGAQAAISMQNALFLAKEREARVAAEEAERRSAFLAEAGTLLAESLDHEATLERLARLCVKSLADWCVIDIVEDGEIRRLAGAHADARLEPLLHQMRQSHTPRWGSPDPAVACLRTGEALVEDALGEERLRRLYLDEAQVALMQELQTRSLMVAPLVARGPALGALTLGAGTPGRYGPGELELAREVAHRAAIAVENALLHRETQRAVRLRDEFLTVASHELRTPMTSLMLSLQNLMRGGAVPPAPETVKRMAGMAQRQGERLTKLIGELLEVTRLEKGLLPLELQEVELVALVREIVDRYEPELVRAGCTVSLEAAAPVRGRWDASRLEQVLVNLLSNAMKFGTGAPIEVSVRAAAGSAWLAVRDHGIGIAPDQQQRIFERFARGVSAQRYGGLGLGLYICRSITQALGGQIRVESAPGQGACFTVQLPLNTGGIEP